MVLFVKAEPRRGLEPLDHRPVRVHELLAVTRRDNRDGFIELASPRALGLTP
jgi:hypothetical protein